MIDQFRYVLRDRLGALIYGPVAIPGSDDSIWLDTVDAPGPVTLSARPATVIIKTSSSPSPTIPSQALWFDQPLVVTYARLSGTTLTRYTAINAHLFIQLRLLKGDATVVIRFDNV